MGLALQASTALAILALLSPVGFVPSALHRGVLAVITAIVVGEVVMAPVAAWLIWWSRIGVWVSSAGVDVRTPRTTRLRWDQIQRFYVAQLADTGRPLERFVSSLRPGVDVVAVRLGDGEEVILGGLSAKSAAVLGGARPSEIVDTLNALVPRAP